MCGSKENFQFFIKHSSLRSIESLKQELISIQSMVKKDMTSTFQWDKAIIGMRDFIFPTKNQLKAWRKIKYEIIDEAHFLDFNKYVDNKQQIRKHLQRLSPHMNKKPLSNIK